MTAMEPKDITATLAELSAGDPRAVERLLPAVYDEMRRLAAGYLKNERKGHTLQPTALAHEAFLRMVVQTDVTWQNRAHFLGVAAQAMRRILVDHARQKLADKRDGGARVTLADLDIRAPEEDLDILAVSDALDVLAQEDPRLSEVVSLRFFAGMSVEETARALDVSPITVKRDWAFARAWLCERIGAAGTSRA
jgi:RNA polymerase sigma factor (TIGR02999 family)